MTPSAQAPSLAHRHKTVRWESRSPVEDQTNVRYCLLVESAQVGGILLLLSP